MIPGEQWQSGGIVPTAEDVKKFCRESWRFIMELEHHAYPQDLSFVGFREDGELVELVNGVADSGMMFMGFFGSRPSGFWVKRTQITLLTLIPNQKHLLTTADLLEIKQKQDAAEREAQEQRDKVQAHLREHDNKCGDKDCPHCDNY